MMIKGRFGAVWMLVNFAGMIVFFRAASYFWIEPELANIPGASGGAAFGWIALAFPIFVFFILAHIVGFARIIQRHAGWRSCSALALVITLGCWLAVFAYDNMRHGI